MLVKRAFCWYLGRSREAASGAVFECSIGNLRAAKRLWGGFGHTFGAVFILPEPFLNRADFTLVNKSAKNKRKVGKKVGRTIFRKSADKK